ncbi:MAG: pitrilysin family protein [Pseudomonadota bacterium]|nr:pitrilysin family protein [Pseudomonadota bacterium]
MACLIKIKILFFISIILLPASLSALEVVEVKSPGGIKAYLSEDHSNPLIALSIQFRGGSSSDSTRKIGISQMVSGLLDEGAGEFDSFSFRSKLENLSIRLSFDSSVDFFSGQMETLTENAEEAFNLLSLSLKSPRFDAEPIERIRRQILVSILRESESPNRIASKVMFSKLFPEHPYGFPRNGTKKTINNITREDLVNFVNTRFAKDRLIIGVAGDITPEELEKVLDKTFGFLPDTLSSDWLKESVKPKFFGTVVIDKDIPQSTLYLAKEGISRNNKDWYAALLANHIFGGGSFTSRLMKEVRVKNGLAYSVSSALFPFVASDLLVASAGTRNTSAKKSLEIIIDEWSKFGASGPTDFEVQEAKKYLKGSWPLRFTSTQSIARTLVSIQRDNLGINYIKLRNNYIDSVNLQDIRRVAKDLYDINKLSIVVVGKPEGIENKEYDG